MIPASVILFWPGTNASIPNRWVRETSLDDKFVKSYGDSVAPNTTGGNNSHAHTCTSHSHTMNAHSHTISNTSYYDPGWEDGGGSNRDPYPAKNHYHLGNTISTISGGTASGTANLALVTNNNHPPYRKLIAIKADTGGAFIIEDMIGFWNSSTLPYNWNACTDGTNGSPALGNKFIRGAGTGADADVTSTFGTNTHTHDASHTHSTSHQHTGLTGGMGNTTSALTDPGSASGALHGANHYITLTSQSLTTDSATLTYTSGSTVEPAYKKLLAIQRTATGERCPKGLIGLWLGATTTIPSGWNLCNGTKDTPDMRDKYLKLANAVGEIGDTGGANTHNHSGSLSSHTHTTSGTHSHGGSVTVGSDTGGGFTGAGGDGAAKPHSGGHTSTVGNNSATVTWASQTISTDGSSVNSEPEYRTVAYIQYVFSDEGMTQII